MKKNLLLLFAAVGISYSSLAATSPKVSICKFKDNKKAAVCLTFDDGAKDHLTVAAPLLKKYGYKGTFYIIVKRVPTKVGKNKLTWGEIKQLADAGHEIGNHSMKHYQLKKAKSRKELEYEIVTPLAIFKEKIGVTPETFCYPGNSRTPEAEEVAESVHVGSTRWGRYFYGRETFSLKAQEEWLENSIKNGKEHLAMIHGIVPGGGGWKPFKNADVFEGVLQNIKKRDKDLWVCTFADLCKYKKVRDSAKISVSQDNGKTSFDIAATEKFNIPVTVKVSPCPAGITAEQNGKKLKLAYRGKDAYINVIPEDGRVILK